MNYLDFLMSNCKSERRNERLKFIIIKTQKIRLTTATEQGTYTFEFQHRRMDNFLVELLPGLTELS